jgi:hypothetical protein
MAFYSHGMRKTIDHVAYNSNEHVDVDPPDHKMAAENVLKWYEDRNYIAFINKRIDYSKEFMTRHKILWTFHKYDVWVYHKISCVVMAVIEIDQKENDSVMLPDKSILAISQSRHNKPTQIRRDNLAEDYIREYYPNVKFLRIQKVDCFYPKRLNELLKGTLK